MILHSTTGSVTVVLGQYCTNLLLCRPCPGSLPGLIKAKPKQQGVPAAGPTEKSRTAAAGSSLEVFSFGFDNTGPVSLN